ncbi:hypothetical protein ACFLZH_03315 [Patescibacteria group bacterium]
MYNYSGSSLEDPDYDQEGGKHLRSLMYLPPSEFIQYLRELEEKNELESFLQEALKNDSFRAYLSYYEKWFETYMNPENKSLVEDIIQTQNQEVSEVLNELPLGLEHKYSEEELYLIFTNIHGVQLTFGCKGNCDFCGFDAPRGVRAHIPYKQLKNMLAKYGEARSSTWIFSKKGYLPYYASDLADYSDEASSKRADDVLKLFKTYMRPEDLIVATRKLPTGNFKEQLRGLKSIRLSTLGLPEQQKKARTETVRKMIAEKENAQYVTGDPKELGLQFSEENDPTSGIGCINALLLTPRGLYSVLQIQHATKKFPQGQIIVPFEGFKPEKKNEVIEKGRDLRDYLSHGIVLRRLEFQKDPNNMFFLYNNQFYKIRYNNEGVIEEVQKYDSTITQLEGEDIKEYMWRLIAMRRTIKSPEEAKTIGQKIEDAFVNLF